MASNQLCAMASASGPLQLNGFATFSRIMQACHKGQCTASHLVIAMRYVFIRDKAQRLLRSATSRQAMQVKKH